MTDFTFTRDLSWNPDDPGGFEPTNVLTAGDRTTISNTVSEYVIQATIPYPGLGNVPVQLVLRPAGTFTLDGGGGLPGGDIREIEIRIERGGGFVTVALIDDFDTAFEAADITTGAWLTAGSDRFEGSDLADLFSGGAGSDRLFGQEGADVLFGGDATDYLDGGDGDDVLSGGAGGDYLYSDLGADALYGGAGSDTFEYSDAGHSLYGYDAQAGRFLGDVIYDFGTGDWVDLSEVAGNIIIADFGPGQNKIIYIDVDGDGLAEDGEGQIVLFGLSQTPTSINIGSRALTFYGSDGADFAYGRANANDVLVGGGGADRFNGFSGADTMYLGANDGAADIVYIVRGQSPYSASDGLGTQADRVYDFTPGQDRLVFTLGDSSLMGAMIQEFGGSTYVYVNRDADEDFDDTVILVNTTGVTLNDLLLGTGTAAPPAAAVEAPDPIALSIEDAFRSWAREATQDESWLL